MSVPLDVWRRMQEGELRFWSGCVFGDTADLWWIREINKRIPFNEGEERLIIGPGPLGAFRRKDLTMIGVDPLVSEYRHRRYEANYTPVRAIGEALPFKDGCFRVVYCLNMLDHGIDPKQVIKEISRVLAQNGVCYLEVDLDHSDRLHRAVSISIVEELRRRFGCCEYEVIRSEERSHSPMLFATMGKTKR